MGLSAEQALRLASRRRKVAGLYKIGYGPTAIARRLHATPRAIRNDFTKLGVTNWSEISDAELDVRVRHYLDIGHRGLGRRLIEARLFADGHLVQRRRIMDALRRLGRHRAPPRRLVRRSFYASVGSWFAVHMDQNEKLAFGGIKLLAAIDGKSRCPVHWKVVTSLRALEHSRFYNELVRRWGRVPAHVVVDGGPWRGVRRAVELYWDDMEPAHVETAEGVLVVNRFQRTSSVHNIPVERSWRDVNDVLNKYYLTWKDLESRGLLVGGRNADPVDLFCLTQVYVPLIKRDVDAHFEAMAVRRKETCTRDPSFPAGTWRPLELLLQDDDYSLSVDADQVDAMDEYITAYHGAEDVEPASAWERDPLCTAAERAERDELVASIDPQTPVEEYIAMREATRHILEG